MRPRKQAAVDFIDHMKRSNALHEEYLSDAALRSDYEDFTQWQLGYVLRHFDDLAEQPGFAAAIEFTVSDFAGIGVSARDAEATRAAPFFTKLLPLSALQALSAAAQLNARSLEINLGVCKSLARTLGGTDQISEAAYGAAYREVTTLSECLELIHLTTELGGRLKGLVRLPLIELSLNTMHGPAHALDFGALQDFLENGYRAFKQIPDVDYFLEEVERRMGDIFARVLGE